MPHACTRAMLSGELPDLRDEGALQRDAACGHGHRAADDLAVRPLRHAERAPRTRCPDRAPGGGRRQVEGHASTAAAESLAAEPRRTRDPTAGEGTTSLCMGR